MSGGSALVAAAEKQMRAERLGELADLLNRCDSPSRLQLGEILAMIAILGPVVARIEAPPRTLGLRVVK